MSPTCWTRWKRSSGSSTANTGMPPPGKEGEPPPLPPIEDLLQEGQEILVQVAKEPLGTKGARITSHISLPGRHLVLMPTVDHVGISRRIENEEEKLRLREIVEAMRPRGTGFIVRTAAEGKSEEDLHTDMGFLIGLVAGSRAARE